MRNVLMLSKKTNTRGHFFNKLSVDIYCYYFMFYTWLSKLSYSYPFQFILTIKIHKVFFFWHTHKVILNKSFLPFILLFSFSLLGILLYYRLYNLVVFFFFFVYVHFLTNYDYTVWNGIIESN